MTDRIRRAESASGRPPGSVRLVAVSKTAPPEAVAAMLEAGQLEFGENRVQEASAKIPAVRTLTATKPVWRLIGHLQRNKVRAALGLFDTVDSVGSVRLWDALASEAERLSRVVPVLVQFNCSGESAKGGFEPEAVGDVARLASGTTALDLRGLMTLGPLAGGPEAARPTFERLAGLKRDLEQRLGRELPELSMGMSADLEVGIACGATQVRVGTAVFGARD